MIWAWALLENEYMLRSKSAEIAIGASRSPANHLLQPWVSHHIHPNIVLVDVIRFRILRVVPDNRDLSCNR